jgi:hypothetical protein
MWRTGDTGRNTHTSNIFSSGLELEVGEDEWFPACAINCPYLFRCECFVALSEKEYKDRVVLLQVGEHDLNCHMESSGILSVKQKGAVQGSARARYWFASTLQCRISVPAAVFRLISAAGTQSIGSCKKPGRSLQGGHVRSS